MNGHTAHAHSPLPGRHIGENNLEWLCADLATWSGGFPNAMISPALLDRMLGKVLAHSACRAAFVPNAAGFGGLFNLHA